MYNYDLLKNEIDKMYMHNIRYVIPILLPKLLFRDKYLESYIGSRIKDIELTYFINILCNTSDVSVFKISNDIIKKLKLFNNENDIIINDETYNDVSDFVYRLFKLIYHIRENYNIEDIFNINMCSFNSLLAEYGYIDLIHELSFINKEYMIVDEYILK